MFAPHSASVDHNDPGSWDAASTTETPVDVLEPAEPFTSEYRECALALLDVLRAVDEFMCSTHDGRPSRKWCCVSLALGLFSTRGKTETEVAAEWGITRASISKDVVRILRAAHLEENPAWGLKSAEHRRLYMHTNGRRRADGVTDTNSELSVGDFPAA